MRLHVETLGLAEGVPVVFLHGFLGEGGEWRPIITRMGGHIHGILPDLPGHGRTIPQTLDYPLSIAQCSLLLRELVDGLGLHRYALVGYSLGGRIALRHALAHPERVSALVLESASPGISDEAERRARAAVDTLRANTIRRDGLPSFLTTWYQQPLFASLAAQPELLKSHIATRLTNHPEWCAKVLEEMSPGVEPPLWDSLTRLQVRTLLIGGGEDLRYTELLRTMVAQIPGAKLVIVPGAGHTVHLEARDRFADVVGAFLAEGM
jgi:2-succinyl-6-hydroxy-2,4-cyclohexadiene-1-carboxylate synthase